MFGVKDVSDTDAFDERAKNNCVAYDIPWRGGGPFPFFLEFHVTRTVRNRL